MNMLCHSDIPNFQCVMHDFNSPGATFSVFPKGMCHVSASCLSLNSGKSSGKVENGVGYQWHRILCIIKRLNERKYSIVQLTCNAHITYSFFYGSTLVFRCCECSCILSRWYYEREGQLYCKKHYWARYGEHCHGCNETITTGLVMVINAFNSLKC